MTLLTVSLVQFFNFQIGW